MSNQKEEGSCANKNPQTQTSSHSEAIMSQNDTPRENISADVQEEYENFLEALEECEEVNDPDNPGCDDLYLINCDRDFEEEGREEGRETVYTVKGIAVLAHNTIEQAHRISFQVAFLLNHPEMVTPEQREAVLQNVYDLNARASNYLEEQVRTSYDFPEEEDEVAA